MIKIGVSAGFIYPKSGQPFYSSKTLTVVENDMMNYLHTPYSIPFAIPDFQNNKFDKYLQQFDVFVLLGGNDVAPEMYGEKPIGNWLGDKYRDEYELKIIDFAVKNNKPILGICRGCQILNVYFEGTLYQDIPTQVTNADIHSNPEIYDLNFHKIKFTGNNELSKLYCDEKSMYVNSIHHQAVKNLGEGLEALCISPKDDIIEAFRHTISKNKIIGIQWHPEFNYKQKNLLLNAEKLLEYFLK